MRRPVKTDLAGPSNFETCERSRYYNLKREWLCALAARTQLYLSWSIFCQKQE